MQETSTSLRPSALEARQVVTVLEDSVGKAVEELLRDLQRAKAERDEHKVAHGRAQRELTDATGDFRAAETRHDDLRARLEERTAGRRNAIDELQAFATITGLFALAVPDVVLPDAAAPWGIEAALAAARSPGSSRRASACSRPIPTLGPRRIAAKSASSSRHASMPSGRGMSSRRCSRASLAPSTTAAGIASVSNASRISSGGPSLVQPRAVSVH